MNFWTRLKAFLRGALRSVSGVATPVSITLSTPEPPMSHQEAQEALERFARENYPTRGR
jgi:hypothetical protein